MKDTWLIAPGRVPYGTAYDAMHELAEARKRDEVPNALILLEHPPTYTAGRRTHPAHLLSVEADAARLGAEVHHVDRGGSVTFHGPGQLVGYPVLALGSAPDVLRYLRDIEETIIRAAADLGAALHRDPQHTGVWAGDRKVCAIGVRMSRGITLHGFALNCTTDLAWFDAIVPCGLTDRTVGTLSAVAGRTVSVGDSLPAVARRFEEVFDCRLVPAPADAIAPWAAHPAEAVAALP